MAEERDDVLSLGGSDEEGSAASEFSGFEPEEVSGGNSSKSTVPSGEVVSSEKSKKSKGHKTKPSESKKGKGPKGKGSKSKTSSSRQKKGTLSAFGIENLSQEEISQLREVLGFNNMPHEEEGPSVFDLYGPSPGNMTIECENEGPASDVEIVPENAPVTRPLNKQLKDALFGNSSEDKENENQVLSEDEVEWQLPKLKAPNKGEAVSSSLADLINTACTKQCDVDGIISRYTIPSNCDKMDAPQVNSEIWLDISRRAQTYDKAFQDIQTLIAVGLVPIIKLTKIMKGKLSEEAQDAITDSITLLGQAQFNLSIRRRYMIRPHLKKKYSALCNIATPVTSQLFGDDLNKEIKKCDTTVAVGRNSDYGRFGQYSDRGQFRGRGRGRGNYHPRGHGYGGPGFGNYGNHFGGNYGGQYGGRGGARFHPYAGGRQQAQYFGRQFQQHAPKKGQRTATVTSPNDTA